MAILYPQFSLYDYMIIIHPLGTIKKSLKNIWQLLRYLSVDLSAYHPTN